MKFLLLTFIFLGLYKVPLSAACAVCFGDPNSPLTQSVGLGVWVLMAFIAGVLALFAAFFLNIRRRMKKFPAAH